VDAADPGNVALGGLRWRVKGSVATCIERLATVPGPSPTMDELRDEKGRILWMAPADERGAWSAHRGSDGRAFAFKRGAGVEVFALREP
jgi:hypothetical protein